MAVKDWSTSAILNTSVGGVNIAPGMQRQDVDNAIRAMMAELKAHFNGLVVDVRTYGAVGDGFEHPLSEFYPSLTAAQVDFPSATSLSNLVDVLAIQRALDAVSASGGRGAVYLPAGRYRGNTGSIQMPDWCWLVGDGPGVSIIDNQSTIATWPLVTNKSATSTAFWGIEGVSLHGGTYGVDLNVTGEVVGLTFRDVSMTLQTVANFRANKLLQTTLFDHVGFDNAPRGLLVDAWTTNAVHFNYCEFTSHTREHIRIVSGEGITFTGGRFEAGGTAAGVMTASISGTTMTVSAVTSGTIEVGALITGANVAANTYVTALGTGTGGAGTYTVSVSQTAASAAIAVEYPTIRITDVGAISFRGVYFEATHKYLLGETSSRNSVSFDDCHFTGAYVSGAFLPYEFASDGRVRFGSNDWGQKSTGPVKMLISGDNPGALYNPASDVWLSRTGNGGRGRSRTRTFAASSTFSVIKIARAADAGTQSCSMRVRVTMTGLNGGGFARTYTRDFLVVLQAVNGVAFDTAIVTGDTADYSTSGFTIALSQTGASNTEVTLQVACSGANAAGTSSAIVSVDYDTSIAIGTTPLTVDFV